MGWGRERDGRQSFDGLGERETGNRALMGWGRERQEIEH